MVSIDCTIRRGRAATQRMVSLSRRAHAVVGTDPTRRATQRGVSLVAYSNDDQCSRCTSYSTMFSDVHSVSFGGRRFRSASRWFIPPCPGYDDPVERHRRGDPAPHRRSVSTHQLCAFPAILAPRVVLAFRAARETPTQRCFRGGILSGCARSTWGRLCPGCVYSRRGSIRQLRRHLLLPTPHYQYCSGCQ